ncbi:sensor domain-containing protein [Mycobacterium sp. 94-17]|uniref:sensor domain-containing protein n=1 Tax=Mycobacterium sp. 94-17 TaxID=2986147 RepID=UPI002D1F06C9|nr:sensor domain-containing protein [Mycobacterium sp. 94-17]MEB4210073.1 sensor domain-containing protein [Mycobacterium sp. 94-17]
MRRLTAALALGGACVVVTSCTGSTHAPVGAGALDGVLLGPAEIEIAMNANGLVNETSTEMSDDSANVPDQDCRFIDSPVQTSVYDGSGWLAMRSQYQRESADLIHQIWEAVVSFPSAATAARFFDASARRWSACSNRQYHYINDPGINDPGTPDTVWTVGRMTDITNTLSVTRGEEGGWACQRALTVSNNVAVDVAACSVAASPGGAGVDIAHQIAAKLAKVQDPIQSNSM